MTERHVYYTNRPIIVKNLIPCDETYDSFVTLKLLTDSMINELKEMSSREEKNNVLFDLIIKRDTKLSDFCDALQLSGHNFLADHLRSEALQKDSVLAKSDILQYLSKLPEVVRESRNMEEIVTYVFEQMKVYPTRLGWKYDMAAKMSALTENDENLATAVKYRSVIAHQSKTNADLQMQLHEALRECARKSAELKDISYHLYELRKVHGQELNVQCQFNCATETTLQRLEKSQKDHEKLVHAMYTRMVTYLNEVHKKTGITYEESPEALREKEGILTSYDKAVYMFNRLFERITFLEDTYKLYIEMASESNYLLSKMGRKGKGNSLAANVTEYITEVEKELHNLKMEIRQLNCDSDLLVDAYNDLEAQLKNSAEENQRLVAEISEQDEYIEELENIIRQLKSGERRLSKNQAFVFGRDFRRERIRRDTKTRRHSQSADENGEDVKQSKANNTEHKEQRTVQGLLIADLPSALIKTEDHKSRTPKDTRGRLILKALPVTQRGDLRIGDLKDKDAAHTGRPRTTRKQMEDGADEADNREFGFVIKQFAKTDKKHVKPEEKTRVIGDDQESVDSADSGSSDDHLNNFLDKYPKIMHTIFEEEYLGVAENVVIPVAIRMPEGDTAHVKLAFKDTVAGRKFLKYGKFNVLDESIAAILMALLRALDKVMIKEIEDFRNGTVYEDDRDIMFKYCAAETAMSLVEYDSLMSLGFLMVLAEEGEVSLQTYLNTCANFGKIEQQLEPYFLSKFTDLRTMLGNSYAQVITTVIFDLKIKDRFGMTKREKYNLHGNETMVAYFSTGKFPGLHANLRNVLDQLVQVADTFLENLMHMFKTHMTRNGGDFAEFEIMDDVCSQLEKHHCIMKVGDLDSAVARLKPIIDDLKTKVFLATGNMTDHIAVLEKHAGKNISTALALTPLDTVVIDEVGHVTKGVTQIVNSDYLKNYLQSRALGNLAESGDTFQKIINAAAKGNVDIINDVSSGGQKKSTDNATGPLVFSAKEFRALVKQNVIAIVDSSKKLRQQLKQFWKDRNAEGVSRDLRELDQIMAPTVIEVPPSPAKTLLLQVLSKLIITADVTLFDGSRTKRSIRFVNSAPFVAFYKTGHYSGLTKQTEAALKLLIKAAEHFIACRFKDMDEADATRSMGKKKISPKLGLTVDDFRKLTYGGLLIVAGTSWEEKKQDNLVWKLEDPIKLLDADRPLLFRLAEELKRIDEYDTFIKENYNLFPESLDEPYIPSLTKRLHYHPGEITLDELYRLSANPLNKKLITINLEVVMGNGYVRTEPMLVCQPLQVYRKAHRTQTDSETLESFLTKLHQLLIEFHDTTGRDRYPSLRISTDEYKKLKSIEPKLFTRRASDLEEKVVERTPHRVSVVSPSPAMYAYIHSLDNEETRKEKSRPVSSKTRFGASAKSSHVRIVSTYDVEEIRKQALPVVRA